MVIDEEEVEEEIEEEEEVIEEEIAEAEGREEEDIEEKVLKEEKYKMHEELSELAIMNGGKKESRKNVKADSGSSDSYEVLSPEELGL